MRPTPPTRPILASLLLATATFSLVGCQALEDAADDAERIATPTLTEAAPVPVATGNSERFVIRDKQKRVRVDGRLRGGRMDGLWAFYDSKGEKLALVNYRLDQRHGPAQLFFVTADGPAVGRLRMTGAYAGGTLHGMVESRWPSGGKKLERDFDRGMLQGARGWNESGARMGDGEAMSAGIVESRAEDALLGELENFVQLQLRRKSANTGAGAGTGEQSAEPTFDLPVFDPATPSPYPGGTAPLANP